MFLSDDFFKALKLNLTYQLVRWNSPPFVPRAIEFLDEQSVLMHDIIHITNAEASSAYFSKHAPTVYLGAVLLISDAADIPENIDSLPENLTIFAFSDSLGKLFNQLNVYINTPAAMDSSKKFSRILSEIIDDTQITSKEVWDKLRELPETVEPFAQIAVVTFSQPHKDNIPYSMIMKRIQSQWPNCSATVRNNSIVFLLTYKERRFANTDKLEHISEILEKYDGYMAISNGTRDLSALRVLWYLTRRALELATTIKVAENTRILTFERVGMYVVIDLCAKGFRSITNTDALMYLAHPAIVAITRYDKEHNDNLRETFYFYLFYDRSVANAANALHMHRNTVMNKIKRIVQVFGLDLDDRHLRQRLLFSLQLIRYYEGIGNPLQRL